MNQNAIAQAAGRRPEEAAAPNGSWDHTTHENFYEYYATESISGEAKVRFRRVRDHILRVITNGSSLQRTLDVADIGCGAGSNSMVWAELGHNVHGLDVNGPLLELGRKRAAEAGRTIDFRVGSATKLPWADASMDVCIALELLEHVRDWEACMREFVRVIRPGGALFLTTTNRLCPHQAEFQLPLYSWYPAFLKRHYVNLAMTTRPQLANFAKYPAFHWFTFDQFRRSLRDWGFRSLDRFDIMDLEEKSPLVRRLVPVICAIPFLRWLGQVCTAGTILLAIRENGQQLPQERGLKSPNARSSKHALSQFTL